MSMQVYECLVLITAPNNHRSVQPVRVTANNFHNARLQLQALYGKDCLISAPVQVR